MFSDGVHSTTIDRPYLCKHRRSSKTVDPELDPEREKGDGDDGEKKPGKDWPSDEKPPESEGNVQTTPRSAAHNPEVAGSSPVSATRKVLKSQDFRTFSLLFR